MIKLLAGSIRFLNSLLVLIILVGGAIVAQEYIGSWGGGIFIDLIGGFIVALIICGLLLYSSRCAVN